MVKMRQGARIAPRRAQPSQPLCLRSAPPAAAAAARSSVEPPPLVSPCSLASRYDCEVVARPGALSVHFDGYASDEDEPLESLDDVRFSSLAAEPADCPALVPGTKVMGFRRLGEEAVWIDARLTARRQRSHEGGKCSCT